MSVEKIQRMTEPYMMSMGDAGEILTVMFQKIQKLIDRTNEIAEALDDIIEKKDSMVGKIASIDLRLERHAKNVNELLAFIPYKPVLNVDEEPNEVQSENS
jgi:hypothetical protein